MKTSLRDEWLLTVESIGRQIKDWASKEDEWDIEEAGAKEIEEPSLGLYTAKTYKVHTPEGEIRLEPIARNYPGRGIVELYAWPTAYRVRLIQDESNGWRVLTDSGIYLHQPWDRDHFITLVRDLVGAEDMIPVG